MEEPSQNPNDLPNTNTPYNVDDFDENFYMTFALFCFEDVPLETIEAVLEGSAANEHEYYYWLADTDYTNLSPSIYGGPNGTRAPLPRTWKSPFVGCTPETAFEHVKNAPGDFLNKKHIVVLDKKLFEERKMLRIYRKEGLEPEGIDEDLGMELKPGDITEVGGLAYTSVGMLIGYDRGPGYWGYYVDEWMREGVPFNG